MRSLLCTAVLLAMATPAVADAPTNVRGETIIIHDRPPAVPAKPVKNYQKIVPRYSDEAVLSDIWAKAWMMLDIDETGTVSRVKVLKHPGHDLEKIAIDTAMHMKFTPAEDGNGHAIRSQMIVPIEWPSYWWMVDISGVATIIPRSIRSVPCRGSGPLMLGSIHPTYRDCSPVDLSAIDREPWVGR